MKARKHRPNWNALNVEIAKSREAATELAAAFGRLVEWERDPPMVEGGELVRADPTDDEGHHPRWTNFRNPVEEAGARSEQVAEGLAYDIKRHPLLSGLAAFGLGFVVASVLHRLGVREARR